MNDCRYRAGRLWYAFLLRQPSEDEVVEAQRTGRFVCDTWLRDHFHGLLSTAHIPEILEPALDSSDDEPVDPKEHRSGAARGRMFHALERERDEARRLAEENHRKAQRIAKERDQVRAALPPVTFHADLARSGVVQ